MKNRSFVTFPALKKDCEVVWSRKLVRWNALTLEHPLHNLNIYLRPLENFLEAVEVEKVTPKVLKST